MLDGDGPPFAAPIEAIEPHGSNDAIYLSADGTVPTAVASHNRIEASDIPFGVGPGEGHVRLFDDRGRRVCYPLRPPGKSFRGTAPNADTDCTGSIVGTDDG